MPSDGTTIGSGHRLGYLSFYGRAGTGGIAQAGASISAQATAAWTSTSCPARLNFITTVTGATVPDTRALIGELSDGVGFRILGKLLRIDTAKTPASAGATGNTGEICWDASYIYICTATNTWKRAALSSW